MNKRKVLLHRETLRTLESGEISNVVGNVATLVKTCPSGCSGCLGCTVTTRPLLC